MYHPSGLPFCTVKSTVYYTVVLIEAISVPLMYTGYLLFMLEAYVISLYFITASAVRREEFTISLMYWICDVLREAFARSQLYYRLSTTCNEISICSFCLTTYNISIVSSRCRISVQHWKASRCCTVKSIYRTRCCTVKRISQTRCCTVKIIMKLAAPLSEASVGTFAAGIIYLLSAVLLKTLTQSFAL